MLATADACRQNTIPAHSTVCCVPGYRVAPRRGRHEAGDGPPVGYIAHVNVLYMLCFNYSYNEPVGCLTEWAGEVVLTEWLIDLVGCLTERNRAVG